MTTTPNPTPIPGLALLAALVVGGVVAGVSVYYSKHDHVPAKQSAPVSQDVSEPPAVTPQAKMDKDGRFLFLLASQGLELDRAADVAINDAHRVCSRLERGESEQQIAEDIVDGSPDMSIDTATSFADIAVEVYCPQANSESPPE
jgi:hypothetical protein